jgi:hypothetical protein
MDRTAALKLALHRAGDALRLQDLAVVDVEMSLAPG